MFAGALPTHVEDPELLGSFQDAIVLYAWRHIVDKYLLSSVAKAVSFFTTYLDLMAPATNFKEVYAESFFQAANLRKFLQLANWEMDDIFVPAAIASSSWTVYHFLTCLSSQASLFDGRLPITGILLLEARHLSMFVYHWFCAMDMQRAQRAASFDSSLLATHLQKWKALTDHPMLHLLWQQAPRDITYWWFRSLREILHPFQLLAMSNRYSEDGGFTNNPRELTITSSCGI